MAEKTQDRVRANRLRTRKTIGKSLTVEESAWLSQYELRAEKSKARFVVAKASAPTVRGPQLEVWTKAPTSHRVHETVAHADSLDPHAHTWIPIVPPAPEGETPPPEGSPTPPAAGSPLVDPPSASDAPKGDPKAALQLAALCVGITKVGLKCGLELAEDIALPDEIRAAMMSDEAQNELLAMVAQSAMNLSHKYGLKAVPMSDEMVVGLAVAGSGVAWFYARRRRELKPAQPRSVTPQVAAPASTPPQSVPTENPVDMPRTALGDLLRNGSPTKGDA